MTYQSVWTDLQGVDFEQRYVDAAGIRTRYLRAGQKGKPALIFIHGTGGHAEAYVRNLEAHAEHFDVYAIDLVGHGYSAKPDHDYTLPLYVDHVMQADTGADLDFLLGSSGSDVSRESH